MKAPTAILMGIIALLVPSFWVVLKGAGDEPYVRFRASDAVVQIGVASALMTLWVLVIVFVTAQVWKKKLHTVWLSALVLSAIALFFLFHAPVDYLSDLAYWKVVVR